MAQVTTLNKAYRYEASGEPGLEDTAGEKGGISRNKDQARPGDADFQFIGSHQAGVCSTDQRRRYRVRAPGFAGQPHTGICGRRSGDGLG